MDKVITMTTKSTESGGRLRTQKAKLYFGEWFVRRTNLLIKSHWLCINCGDYHRWQEKGKSSGCPRTKPEWVN